jgi:hypothetical protein
LSREDRLKWYKKEFEKISHDINHSPSLSYYDFLRIRNYKLQNISIAKEQDIKKFTSKAFKLAEEDNIVGAVEQLIELNGVGIPVASAILAMKYPERFAIIDRRVLQALGEGKWIKNYQKDPKIYKDYLIRIRQEARKKRKKLREYELHLFVKGKE